MLGLPLVTNMISAAHAWCSYCTCYYYTFFRVPLTPMKSNAIGLGVQIEGDRADVMVTWDENLEFFYVCHVLFTDECFKPTFCAVHFLIDH